MLLQQPYITKMKTKQLLTSALLLLIYIPSSDPVTVTTSKAKMDVHENTNAVLSCEFRTEKETNPRVEWKKRGKDVSYVYFEGDFTGSYKGRASIDGATLTLRGVTQKDSGVYHCEVTARQDKIKLGEVSVTLSVLVPPHAPTCEVPEAVMRGFSAELHCKDKLSVPAATYSWYKDNKPLNTANPHDVHYTLDTKTGSLKFKSVSKSDEGQYRCEASNGVGAPKSCAGHHMKITEFELNMTMIIAIEVGAFLLLVSCCVSICLCCRRGCCHCCRRQSKEEIKQSKTKTSYNQPTDPRRYKHTQSFVL
ncbi:junctional adhesion molecule 2b precursor [Danio rerio]|uniref:Junctional adhesion molecule 2b n=1 Tax=Danio rerio TaxID=7955 RepID=B0V233_DANRE|nr:junctional adhesion molecule 2b precursor [Danio rerio]|eukprot:NP_001121766.1 junctional adhesion molecule 2 precursor [Danio rerio]